MNNILLITLFMGIILFYSYYSLALPASPSIDPISNSTSSTSGVGQLRSGDDGGYIVTLNLNALQQNLRW